MLAVGEATVVVVVVNCLYTDVVRPQAGRGTDLRTYQMEAVLYQMDVGGGLLVASIKR